MVLAQAPRLSGKVAVETALEDGPVLGIGFEIPPQRCHFPAQRTRRLHCHRVHFGRGAARRGCGADIPGPRLTQDPSILRHTHLAADNECDRVGRRAVSIKRSPGAAVVQEPRLTSCSTLRDGSCSNASRRTSSVGRELDRTTFEVETPGLEGIDSSEDDAPADRCPLRCGLKDEVWERNQRRGHREQPQPADAAQDTVPQPAAGRWPRE